MSLYSSKKKASIQDRDDEGDVDEESLALISKFSSSSENDHKEQYGSTHSVLGLPFNSELVQTQGTAVGQPALTIKPVELEHLTAELLYQLFMLKHPNAHSHSRTSPFLPPEKRFTRHRNFNVYCLNKFRHWWKTSRLLVRISGGFVMTHNPKVWSSMSRWNTEIPKQAKKAFKQYKKIGRGGSMKLFLNGVQPFTRSIRIILAVARAWEARVDNRFYEVGLAEAMAFVGNRCSRYFARRISDWLTRWILLPLSGLYLAPHLIQKSRPVIIAMGMIRALLPFIFSFQGSRFGRQLTYSTYKYANHRWKSVQSITDFHAHTGTYQDTNLDLQLLSLARKVAVAIGHGKDPIHVRLNLSKIGFNVYGCGSGGYACYRLLEQKKIVTVHVTPSGPSILNEMPRYILLERRSRWSIDVLACEAQVRGFTYSGAYFQSQEWAALRYRFNRELSDYDNACKVMGTSVLSPKMRNPQSAQSPSPPKDLQSLKTFLRSGRLTFIQRYNNYQWNQIKKQIDRMGKLIAKYQTQVKAPKQVILYLEGLDCSGKSSTGMLICQALEQCGYSVTTARHNRPPTAEQKLKPWLDRSRFEHPQDMYENADDIPEYASLVWDRGPAGDFVYGDLYELPMEKKLERFKEFRTYDYQCRADGILFLKCFFVTDRDSIAKTLGKRLAHKKIVGDLLTWLDANSLPHVRDGLEEIKNHIDPTDFVAFNKYEENLHKFSEFARNTDYVGDVGGNGDIAGYSNPWLVINTSNRHSARLKLLNIFCHCLNKFAAIEKHSRSVNFYDQVFAVFGKHRRTARPEDELMDLVPDNNIVQESEYGISARAVFQSFILLLLFYAYLYQSWGFTITD